MDDSIRAAVSVVPSERQINWQRTEFYGFVHFGINTFTDREWGTGDEDPKLFNPSELDADQWVRTFKAAGMRGLILTCKHHDGFCLWPSRYTDYSVASSEWRGGRGDLVREVSNACARSGIRFGIYLSPWDRHERTYGDSGAYNHFYLGQLRELLTSYGEIFSVWLDGACGEGPNGKRQVYDWEAYYQLIRELQPGAVISVCGPDVRWCGNEAGHCRESEWSVVPAVLTQAERTQEKSQKVDDGRFSRLVNTQDADLGSREAIRGVKELVWYPAEVNTSIRPGWFYHPAEDDQVRTTDELLRIYYGSVGGNACFLLNLPPDRRGLIHERDAIILEELGTVIQNTFSENLARQAKAFASDTLDSDYCAENILDGNANTYWRPSEGNESPSIEIDFSQLVTFDRVVLCEHIRSGQRIESFSIDYWAHDGWVEYYRGTVVGYKRICCFERIESRRLRIRITGSRYYPTLSEVGVYLERR